MSRTSASLFTGGGLADVGLMQAGFTPIWGVEYRQDIADVCRRNLPGMCVHVADVRGVCFEALETPDHLHASPVCKNASIANSDGRKSREDVETAEAVCRALRVLKPRTFTLENVYGYRKFVAYRAICACLVTTSPARQAMVHFSYPGTR